MVEIVRGTYVAIPFAALAANGSALDLSVSGRSLKLRMTPDGSTSPTITRTTGTSGEYEWTVQASGTGNFLMSTTATAAMTVGWYTVEVTYTATSESKVHIVYGPTRWIVRDPGTGAL